LEADLAFRRSLGFFREEHLNQLKSVFYSYQAEWAVWQGDFILARSQAGRTQQLASFKSFEGDNIRTDRLQGQSALGLGELIQAGEWLHLALTRLVNKSDPRRMPTLIALSELYRRQGDEKAARELLDEVWEAAERALTQCYMQMLAMYWLRLSRMLAIMLKLSKLLHRLTNWLGAMASLCLSLGAYQSPSAFTRVGCSRTENAAIRCH
jgi:tetratricopeptide (TPR) repeat protein